MGTIYITEQGSVLRKVSRRLVISKGEETLLDVPIIKVDRVLLFGNVQVTSQAMAFLMESGIDICFLSSKGKFRGRLAPAESKNVFLRIAQYERYLEDEFPREQARVLVEAKIKNGRALILRFVQNHPEVDFSQELEGIDHVLSKLKLERKIPSILGIEGIATATYFRAFGRMFRKGLTFSHRTRRPPKDPVNALLSFGYTLITNEILSLLFAVGFDPYIGYLHGIDYGRPSLALDLVEEFRHPLVDRLTLNLFNNEVLSADDFEAREDGGFFLKPEARKIYLQHYERRMNEEFQDAFSGERVTYRSLFRRQVQRLAQAIQTREPYQPFRIK